MQQCLFRAIQLEQDSRTVARKGCAIHTQLCCRAGLLQLVIGVKVELQRICVGKQQRR